MKSAGPLAVAQPALCAVMQITRTDGMVYGYTDHDQPLLLASGTFSPAPGVAGIKVTLTNNAQVGTVQARSAWVPTLTESDIVAGVYDNATIRIGMANWQQPNQDVIWLFSGLLGTINATKDGFQAEAVSALWVLQRPLGVFTTTNCRHVLGSKLDPAGVWGCQVDLTKMTYSGVITAVANAMTFGVRVTGWDAAATPNTPNAPTLTVTQGVVGQFLAPGSYSYSVSAIDGNGQESSTSPIATATIINNTGNTGGGTIALSWTAIGGATSYNVYGNTSQQLLANVTGTTWTDNGTAGSGGAAPLFGDYFASGIITMTSGSANGMTTNVKSLVSTGVNAQTLYPLLPFGRLPAVGDAFTITPGCSKSVGACQYKFNNVINYGGFPDLSPQREWM